jgi:hypothetical protein
MSFGTSLTGGDLVEINGNHVALFAQGYREICPECTGTGYRPGYAFSDQGRCWPCNYSGLRPGKFRTAVEMDRLFRTRVTRAANAAKKAAEKWAVAKAEYYTWLAARPEIAAIAAEFGNVGYCGHGSDCYWELCDINSYNARQGIAPLLLELAGYASLRVITDAQAALLVKLAAEHAAKLAERAIAAQKAAERAWLGEEGAKITVTGTLTSVRHIDGDYGYSTLYKVTTAAGDVATWFRSGYHEAQEGAAITLTGQVKKLNESEKWGKETVLTRCKIS